MKAITLSRAEATIPGRLPHRCLRCNSEATTAVPRPVADPTPNRRFVAGPHDPTDHTQGSDDFSTVGFGLILILGGLLCLRQSRRHWAKAVWLLIILQGVGLTVCGLLGLFGVKLPHDVMVPQLIALVPSMAAVVWFAGYVKPRRAEGLQALIPVCDRHRHHWESYQRLVAGFTLGAIVYIVGLVYVVVRFVGNPLGTSRASVETLFCGLLGLIAILAVAAFFCREPVKAVFSEGDQIVIRGVSPEYAREHESTAGRGSASR
jgi:hypothetical protein